MVLLAIFFALSICFSFLCSIWEAVLLSITPSYANRKMQEGSELGRTLKEYKEDIDRPLSAILTLNTIAHTVGAIGVGAQAGNVFGGQAMDLGFMSLSAEAIIASLMTLAILILSEIIPKTIGANKWESLTPFTLRSLKVILFLLAPLVWLSQLITKRFKKDKHKSVFNRADFTAMAAVGEKSGAIDQSESRIISNLLQLRNLTVHDIMTPRTVVNTAPENISVRKYYDENQPFRFSRIPIYKDQADNIVGLVLKDDILKHLAEGKDDVALNQIMRSIEIVSNKMSLQELFDLMLLDKQHLAAVVDSYGSLVGLVSMEDLLETLLGLEITDESDKDEDMQHLAKSKWEERAKQHGIKGDS